LNFRNEHSSFPVVVRQNSLEDLKLLRVKARALATSMERCLRSSQSRTVRLLQAQRADHGLLDDAAAMLLLVKAMAAMMSPRWHPQPTYRQQQEQSM
jgi:hypothetical protein